MNARTSERRSQRSGIGTATEQTTHLASKVELLSIASLVPYAGNAREHSDRSIRKLAGTIKAVGFLVPVIVDVNDIIIAGHGRFAAAKQLGMATIPCIRVSHLTEAQIRAFRIADNRLAELSTWDDKALALELKELAAFELDPEILDLTAFEVGEIDFRIASLEAVEEKSDPADEVEDVAGRAVTQLGDLWLLGKHRLYCGSSLDEASYHLLLEGNLVRAVWADAPYNVPVKGHVSGLGKTQHREFVMASGEMTEDEFTNSFLAPYFMLTKKHSMPGSLHYSCMDAAHTYELLTAARCAGLAFKTTCTWAKTNGAMGSLYRQQTEFVHVFKNGGNEVQHINNVQLGKYGRTRTTLWSYPGVNSFGRARTEELSSHPTVKPWAMVADAIKDCTKHGESVLDPFCGSGTTIVAAEKVGRIAFGIELDPLYIDVSIRRFEKAFRQSAVHAETGLTFREFEKQRSAIPVAAA
jgi:ParB-like chromosome segregation protein Spo0J